METWLNIDGYDGMYQISNMGNVRSFAYGKTKDRKIHIDKHGYCCVGLRKNGVCKTHRVHMLVAAAFLNYCPNGRVLNINHKDFVKTNNRVENLEIITHHENVIHASKQKAHTSKFTGVSFDSKSKLWMSQIQVNNKNILIGRFNNEVDAANAYNEYLKTILDKAKK
jgi:hypothetical protein